jgi:uncharacterized protein (TIGR02145 family)
VTLNHQKITVMKKLFLWSLIITLFVSCKKKATLVEHGSEIYTASADNKDQNKNLTVTTISVLANSAIKALLHGNISYGGGGNSIVDRGFCYATIPDPTLSNDTAQAGSGAGDFSILIQGLAPGTVYYARAYARKNNGEIYYGNELRFTTLTLGLPGEGIGSVTDIDGNIYQTATLGSQVWMVENLKTTRYRDGTPIANITDNTAWSTTTTGAYCDYNNDPSKSEVYGRLYNWFAATDPRNIAPAGWHVPSSTELLTLITYLGGAGIAGGRMKEAGTAHWLAPNTGADNSSGFTALGSGFRIHNGSFTGFQARTIFWSTSSLGVFIGLDYNSADFHAFAGGFPPIFYYGHSIRCVKD